MSVLESKIQYEHPNRRLSGIAEAEHGGEVEVLKGGRRTHPVLRECSVRGIKWDRP